MAKQTAASILIVSFRFYMINGKITIIFGIFKLFINTLKWRIIEPRSNGRDNFHNDVLVSLLPEPCHSPCWGPLI